LTVPVGDYARKHTIWMVCDSPDGCEEEVSDSLRIATSTDGAIDIRIELVGANAHICTFEGVLGRVADRAWQYRAPASEAECLLDLEWTETELVVSSEGCRDYCGVRAYLDAKFPFSSTKP